ncbi:MAG TPA: hypothetical protein VF730_06690 [Terracidiphilus sp.]
MPTLNLGVVDVGYTDDEGSVTTGDVASWLEERYHIMRTFVELNEGFIEKCLVDAASGAIESIAQGRPISGLNAGLGTRLDARQLFGSSVNERIEERFRDFLDSGEMNRYLPPSQQSQAAAQGINHRKKNPNTGQGRQAFVDTGLYQAAFRAWMTGDR